MSSSVGVVCPHSWSLGSFEACFEERATAESAHLVREGDRLLLTSDAPDAPWYVDLRETFSQEFAIEESRSNPDLDPRFRSEVESLRFFHLAYNDFEVTRRLLRSIAHKLVRERATGWFDTDHGWVIHVNDFVAALDEDPGWDWRRVPAFLILQQ